MNNISFCANLIVNDNLANKLPKASHEDFPNKLVSDYQEFLDMPKIKKMTEGDTIELKKGDCRGGFAIEMTVTNGESEPFTAEIHTDITSLDVPFYDLKYWTLIYLCHKMGKKPRFAESGFGMIDRVLFNGKLKKP